MSKILEALMSAVEHRERISLDDIDAANLLAEIERLRAENDALRQNLDLHRRDWSRLHHLMAAQGWHPGRTDDDLIDVLRDKLSGMWGVIEQILQSGHTNTEDLARLRAVFAPPTNAPQ